MKKCINKIALLLSMILALSLLSACGDKAADDSGDSGNGGSNEETVTLTAWVPESIRIEDWNTNAMTLWLEEQTGYDLELIPLSSEDYTTKVNISMTAGNLDELPDIVFGSFGDTAVWSWAEAGSIISLSDYYSDPELS